MSHTYMIFWGELAWPNVLSFHCNISLQKKTYDHNQKSIKMPSYYKKHITYTIINNSTNFHADKIIPCHVTSTNNNCHGNF